MSMARYGTVLSFSIGTLQISREFVVTGLSGSHQIILGYSFLKDYNPVIDWSTGILKMKDHDSVQAIVTKRTADVKILSAKQMFRLLNKEVIRK